MSCTPCQLEGKDQICFYLHVCYLDLSLMDPALNFMIKQLSHRQMCLTQWFKDKIEKQISNLKEAQKWLVPAVQTE